MDRGAVADMHWGAKSTTPKIVASFLFCRPKDLTSRRLREKPVGAQGKTSRGPGKTSRGPRAYHVLFSSFRCTSPSCIFVTRILILTRCSLEHSYLQRTWYLPHTLNQKKLRAGAKRPRSPFIPLSKQGVRENVNLANRNPVLGVQVKQ